jgi:hypothetical protein
VADLRRSTRLLALTALSLGVACGKAAKERTPPVATRPAEPPPPAPPPPAPPPAPKADEPPELSEIKARIVEGDRSTRTLKELQKLSYKYPKNAEVSYILGQLYCDKLWMNDGLKFFQRAIELDRSFRSNPYLIKAVIAGLGNDSDHKKVERFITEEIGQPAAPFLEEVLQGSWRQQVKDRAAAILQKLK